MYNDGKMREVIAKGVAVIALAVFLMAVSYNFHIWLYYLPIMNHSHTNAATACVVIYVIVGSFVWTKKFVTVDKHDSYPDRPYLSDDKRV